MRQVLCATANLFAILSAVAIAACGGGGAGGSSMPDPPSGGNPSPSPTPPPSPASVSGTVTNFDGGAALGGAIVKIGNLAPVTTNGSGHYTVSGIPGGSVIHYIQVTDGASFATYNSGVAITSGQTTTRNVKLMNPSTNCAQCVAWLTQVNADRAANGAGPVAFDEHAMEAARLHSTDMATQGYGSHWDTNGQQPWFRYANAGGVGFDEENWCENNTWQACETAFMAEGPGGAHYNNIVDTHHEWVGVWYAPYTAGPVGFAAGDQEFVSLGAVTDPSTLPQSAVAAGTSVSFKARLLSNVNTPTFEGYGHIANPSPLTPSQLDNPPYNDGYGYPSDGFTSFTAVPGDPTLVTITFTPSASASEYVVSPVAGTIHTQ
jgi:cysteine-rich secretory family protein